MDLLGRQLVGGEFGIFGGGSVWVITGLGGLGIFGGGSVWFITGLREEEGLKSA